MDIILSDSEVRIIACLIEKELTTPEYYPLSLNSLTNACNQKSNRNPVVSYNETDVARILGRLQEKNLVRKTLTSGSRVTKYLHAILDRFDLTRQEMAILCELMLRGPQTVGEVRSHTERMSAFESLEEVESTLQGLAEHDPPLALKMAREAGRKECRFMHLFSGGVEIMQDFSTESEEIQISSHEKIKQLEEQIVRMRIELDELKHAFSEFKSQF
ncbi:MAG: YceH family protein [Dissulfurispiraceae bacterium]